MNIYTYKYLFIYTEILTVHTHIVCKQTFIMHVINRDRFAAPVLMN